MLLGEPAPTQGDLHFHVFGMPVRIHPMFWLVAIILGVSGKEDMQLKGLLVWTAAFFVAIFVHELGHALVCRWFGIRPWIILYGMGGLTAYSPAEYQHSAASKPLNSMFLSFAGPLAGFLMVGLVFAAIYLDQFFPFLKSIPGPLQETISWIVILSLFWGVLNLLPVYPLDGGHIAREFFLWLSPSDGIRQSLILSMMVAVAVGAFALMKLGSLLIPLFFGFMAYENYMAIQTFQRRGW